MLLNRDVEGAVEVDEEEGEVFRTSGIAGLQTHDGAVAARCSRAGGRGAMAWDGEGKRADQKVSPCFDNFLFAHMHKRKVKFGNSEYGLWMPTLCSTSDLTTR